MVLLVAFWGAKEVLDLVGEEFSGYQSIKAYSQRLVVVYFVFSVAFHKYQLKCVPLFHLSQSFTRAEALQASLVESTGQRRKLETSYRQKQSLRRTELGMEMLKGIWDSKSSCQGILRLHAQPGMYSCSRQTTVDPKFSPVAVLQVSSMKEVKAKTEM